MDFNGALKLVAKPPPPPPPSPTFFSSFFAMQHLKHLNGISLAGP